MKDAGAVAARDKPGTLLDHGEEVLHAIFSLVSRHGAWVPSLWRLEAATRRGSATLH